MMILGRDDIASPIGMFPDFLRVFCAVQQALFQSSFWQGWRKYVGYEDGEPPK
jgi:hypothetical protein